MSFPLWLWQPVAGSCFKLHLSSRFSAGLTEKWRELKCMSQFLVFSLVRDFDLRVKHVYTLIMYPCVGKMLLNVTAWVFLVLLVIYSFLRRIKELVWISAGLPLVFSYSPFSPANLLSSPLFPPFLLLFVSLSGCKCARVESKHVGKVCLWCVIAVWVTLKRAGAEGLFFFASAALFNVAYKHDAGDADRSCVLFWFYLILLISSFTSV